MNTFLFIIKAVATFRSGSLSVMASLLDSGLDLASGIVLIVVQYLMETLDPDRYPTGKKRFEPLGILVFSCMMFVAAAKVIEEAVYKLLDPNKIDVQLDIFTLAILVTVIVVKGDCVHHLPHLRQGLPARPRPSQLTTATTSSRTHCARGPSCLRSTCGSSPTPLWPLAAPST